MCLESVLPYNTGFCFKCCQCFSFTRGGEVKECAKCVFFTLRQSFLFWSRVFLTLSAAGHVRGPSVHYTHVWAPAGLRDARSRRSKPRRAGSCRGIAFYRARAKQDDGNPHKTNHQQVFACSAVRNSSHLVWSPGHLVPRAWAPGHFAPRSSSRATSATLRAHFFMSRWCFCVCTSCVFEDDEFFPHQQRCNSLRFGNTAVDSVIEGYRLMWELSCLG